MTVNSLVRVQIVHDFLGPQTQPDLFVLVVQHENAVLDFVPPYEVIALEVLDAVVGGDELADACFADVVEVAFGGWPWLGGAYFE